MLATTLAEDFVKGDAISQTVIDAGTPVVTLVNVFTVEPDKQLGSNLWQLQAWEEEL
jgi:hypothetical protein